VVRIKALVRYIGQLVGEGGQWVGVEALESVIPADAGGLAWGNGTRNGGSFCVFFLRFSGR
jgi:dynactin complex subunit